jgi:hypothetical protein
MLQNLKRRQQILLYIAIGVALLFFYAFMYSDILITTSFGINIWDALFDGNIFKFYDTVQSDVNNAAYQIYNSPDYYFLIYVIFGIWDFPLWFIRQLTNFNIWESALAMIWAKTIVLLFIVLVIIEIKNICRTLSLDDKRINNVIMVFVTSPILYMGAFVISQYDIIYLFFMLKAFNYYLKGDMWKFTGYIAVTLPIKPLSIFLFMPLLLYSEKNIIKIAVKTLVLFLPWLIFDIIFPIGDNVSGNMSNILVMFSQKFEFRGYDIPLFILSVIILYLYCYIVKPKEDLEARNLDSVKIAFMAYCIFFVTCPTVPYWYILILPFMCILIGLNGKYMYINIIIESLVSLCYIGIYVWIIPWCFDARLLRSTYVGKIFGDRYDTTNNILEIIHDKIPALYEMAEDRAETYLFMLFFAGTLMFIFINYCKHGEIVLEGKAVPKYIYMIRYIASLCVCLIPVIAYIF